MGAKESKERWKRRALDAEGHLERMHGKLVAAGLLAEYGDEQAMLDADPDIYEHRSLGSAVEDGVMLLFGDRDRLKLLMKDKKEQQDIIDALKHRNRELIAAVRKFRDIVRISRELGSLMRRLDREAPETSTPEDA